MSFREERRMAIIADNNHFRRLGLNLFLKRNEVTHGFEKVYDGYAIKFCSELEQYRSATIIGNHTAPTSLRISNILRRQNNNINVFRVLFSDIIGLRKLQRHLIISPNTIIVSADISFHSLQELSLNWTESFNTDAFNHVKFSHNEVTIMKDWAKTINNNIMKGEPNGENKKFCYVSNRLKNRFSIFNRNALYKLWSTCNSYNTPKEPISNRSTLAKYNKS